MKRQCKWIPRLLSAVLVLGLLPAAWAAEKPPEPSGYNWDSWGDYLQINFTHLDTDYLDAVDHLAVDGTAYEEATSSFSMGSGKYYSTTISCCLMLGIPSPETGKEYTAVISADGYENLTLSLHYNGQDWSGAVVSGEAPHPDPEPDPDDGRLPQVSTPENWGYLCLSFQNGSAYVGGVSSLAVNGAEWILQESSKLSLSGQQYYLDSDNGQIFFDGLSGVLHANDLITIRSEGYEDLTLRVTGTSPFAVEVYDGSQIVRDVLHTRLVGTFEPALVGQQKIDAVSGASTGVSVNQNSDVVLEAAVLPEGQEPTEEDWKLLSESAIRVDPKKTSVTISPESSGMTAVYSTLDSSLTLAGVPERAGEYEIRVFLTDTEGREAHSNVLPFRVHDGGQVTLQDRLKLEYAVQTADGKYMYDMEPWAITQFGGEDETVTVPADIKAWYGSHTSGTYGELGISGQGQEPSQTLIVPADCTLTLVNMKLYGGVRVVVEKGGTLILRDSSVHGVIDVMEGGVFSMNYDDYSGQFLTGASLNGQLRLHNGAILENALIYSNSNSLSDGDYIRVNDRPVVTAEGNVTVRGQVFVRGDEAATGAAGQPALLVKDGTLTVEEGAVLALYGGGHMSTTTDGGDALLLEGGTVTGDGRLIAVGGAGSLGSGGSAVSGDGSISVSRAYLEGGNAYFSKETDRPGQALSQRVTLSDATARTVIDGQAVHDNLTPYPQTSYWTDVTTLPDLSLYPVEEPDGPDEPDTPDTPSQGGNTGGSGSSGSSSRPSSGEVLEEEKVPLSALPWENPFMDVAETDWFYSSVRDSYEAQLMIGTGPDTFSPEADTTLGMVLTVLHRLSGSPAADGPLPFSDVEHDSYCAEAIRWALETGLIQETADGLFRPDAALALEDLEAMVEQYLQVEGLSASGWTPDGVSGVTAGAREPFSPAQAALLFLALQQEIVPSEA